MGPRDKRNERGEVHVCNKRYMLSHLLYDTNIIMRLAHTRKKLVYISNTNRHRWLDTNTQVGTFGRREGRSVISCWWWDKIKLDISLLITAYSVVELIPKRNEFCEIRIQFLVSTWAFKLFHYVYLIITEINFYFTVSCGFRSGSIIWILKRHGALGYIPTLLILINCMDKRVWETLRGYY